MRLAAFRALRLASLDGSFILREAQPRLMTEEAVTVSRRLTARQAAEPNQLQRVPIHRDS